MDDFVKKKSFVMERSVDFENDLDEMEEECDDSPLLKAKIQGIHFLSAFLKIWLCVSDFVPLNFARDSIWAQAANKTNDLSLLYVIESSNILDYEIPDWALPLKEKKKKTSKQSQLESGRLANGRIQSTIITKKLEDALSSEGKNKIGIFTIWLNDSNLYYTAASESNEERSKPIKLSSKIQSVKNYKLPEINSKPLFKCLASEFHGVISKLSKNNIKWVVIVIYEAGIEFYGYDVNKKESMYDYLGIVSVDTLYDPDKTLAKSLEGLDFSETLPKQTSGIKSDVSRNGHMGSKIHESSLPRQGKKALEKCVVKVNFDRIKCFTRLRTVAPDAGIMEFYYNHNKSLLIYKCPVGPYSCFYAYVRSSEDQDFLKTSSKTKSSHI